MARKRDAVSGEGNKNPTIKDVQPSIQTEQYRGAPRKHDKRAMKLVNHFAPAGMNKMASADISQGTPIFYHPDYEPSSLMLPKDRIEINSWCNYFYKYDALVATAIDTHAELPLSKIKLDMPKTKNKELANRVLEHYIEMIGNTKMDLFNKLLMVGIEYNKLGNVFPWAQLDSDGTSWSKLSCLDPDYINLERLNLTDTIQVSLQPNDRLRMIVNGGPINEKTGRIYQSLPEDIIEAVKTGRPIPLETDPNQGSHVAHIARKMADYHVWGTSLIERNFKTLVYKDRLRQSQDAIAARHLTPKHLIWADNASRADVREIREQVEDAMMNPDSSIITNYELHWDLVGTSNGLMQLQGEYEGISEELFIGLMINKSFLLGEGPYAGGQTVLEVLAQKYAIFREQLESYIERSLFATIARNCGFVEYEPGTLKHGKVEKLIYPKVRWNKLNLVDDTQHKQMMAQMVAEGKLDLTTWLEYFGINSDAVADRIKKNEDTVLDPAYMELRRTMMNEVGRSLGPEVAKMYAKGYGIELPDPNAPADGGGIMPTASSGRMRFGNDMKVEYNADGGFTIEPKLEKVPQDFDTKIAETREERSNNRDDARSRARVDLTKEKLEVVPTENRMKPERKDLQKKKAPKLFEASEKIKDIRQAIDGIEIDPDLKPEEIHASIELKGSTASDVGAAGYENVEFSDPKKSAAIRVAIKKAADSKQAASHSYTAIGLDPNARRLSFVIEDKIVSEFKKLTNRVENSSVKSTMAQYIPQLYGAILYAKSDKTETLQNVSAQAKNTYAREISGTIAKAANKVDAIAGANRKLTENDPAEKVISRFNDTEEDVRNVIRTAVKAVVELIDSSLT